MAHAHQTASSYNHGASSGLDESAFKRISEMMERSTGIIFPESKRSLVQGRISKRMTALNIFRFDEYIAFLNSPEGQTEQEQLVFSLTTNVTRFFREPHHFTDLKDNILPKLISRAKSGQRVRIWSAGCSSGEEPYSIALLALDADPGIGQSDFKILATDLDRNMVRTGRKGRYSPSALQSSDEAFSGLLRQEDNAVVMPEAAKQLITFRELNLLHDWPFKGTFDVIFCRNVVIYFKDDVAEKLWKRFSDRLEKGGRLYSGHSERIRSPDQFNLKPYGITSFEKL